MDKKKKKDYMYPKTENLHVDALMPIYLNYREERYLLGYAKLNKRVSSNLKGNVEFPYVRAEIGGTGKKEPDCVIWGIQRWNITYVDPWEYDSTLPVKERWKYLYQKDFTTNWYIGYFITVNAYHTSDNIKE